MNDITLICTIVGAVAGIWGALRYANQDTKQDASAFTRVETKLDWLGKDIADIKRGFENLSSRIKDVEERVTRVEESSKQAHKRIDGLKEID